jgi:predicted nucleic acid-binding protein
MIVVADTGPVNYLILSGQVDLAHTLYGVLVIPHAVFKELRDPRAPSLVHQWVNALPSWVEIRAAKPCKAFDNLGAGEREAISLALEVKADFLLMDETRRNGRTK